MISIDFNSQVSLHVKESESEIWERSVSGAGCFISGSATLMISTPNHVINVYEIQYFDLWTAQALAGAGLNARFRRGAPFSICVMTSCYDLFDDVLAK